MIRLFIVLGLISIMAAIAALRLVDKAEYNAWFGDPVNYARHLPPAEAVTANSALDLYSALQEGEAVPRTFLASLPEDLAQIDQATQRKRLFIASLVPLGLRANEIIEADRARFLAIRGKIEASTELTTREARWLRARAKTLGITDIMASLDEMDRRLRPIPLSLMVAQAAIESGWGTSRFVRQGNALFGQWTWNEEDDGIVPKARKEGAKHRIKAFGFLIQSVRGYARNMNRHPAYARFRILREQQMKAGKINSMTLAETLESYSERRQDYVRDLQAIIAGNQLMRLDQLRFRDDITADSGLAP